MLPVAQHPVYASLRGDPIPHFGWEPFIHPHISIQKQIVHFCSKTGTITFEDGTKVEDVDHVIFGTGYTFSFPFLPKVQERVVQADRRLPGVYYHTWDIEDPNLAFLGMVSGVLYSRMTWLLTSSSVVEALRSDFSNGKLSLSLDFLLVEETRCHRRKSRKNGRGSGLPSSEVARRTTPSRPTTKQSLSIFDPLQATLNEVQLDVSCRRLTTACWICGLQWERLKASLGKTLERRLKMSLRARKSGLDSSSGPRARSVGCVRLQI